MSVTISLVETSAWIEGTSSGEALESKFMLLEPTVRRLIGLTETHPVSGAEVGLSTGQDAGLDHQKHSSNHMSPSRRVSPSATTSWYPVEQV